MTASMAQFIYNLHWMGWNLFLAMIPLVLSLILFARRSPRQSKMALHQQLLWWFGLGILILFLPNAPYILTDIIHFIDDTRLADITDNGIILILIPQYVLFLLWGFQCYVLSVMQFSDYMIRQKILKRSLPLEISLHFLCAIGVYWGRFNRLNSWDLFAQPQLVIADALANLLSVNFYISIFLFFIVFAFLYSICKWLNLAIAFYWHNSHNQRDRVMQSKDMA